MWKLIKRKTEMIIMIKFDYGFQWTVNMREDDLNTKFFLILELENSISDR